MNKTLHFLSIILLIGVFAQGSFSAYQCVQQASNPNRFAIHQLASQFTPYIETFNNQQHAGYITHKNIEDPLNIARFELAQFVLAPCFIHLSKADYPLVFLDAQNPDDAKTMLNTYSLIPVRIDQMGLILAVNKMKAKP